MNNTKCNFCKGSGWITIQEADPKGYHENTMMGFSDDTKYTCPFCDGSGVLDYILELQTKIKELTDENQKLFDENLKLENAVKLLRFKIEKLEE